MKNILRCYAIYDPEIEYCQGMNFIAGFLYLVFQDEAIAFAMFTSMMQRLPLVGFYQPKVPLIRQYIYQTNRLLAIYLPKLYNHFFEKEVSIVFFSSAWFLTSFCYVLQYCKTTDIPALLFGIYDKYLFVFLMYKYRMVVMFSYKLPYSFLLTQRKIC